MAEESQNRANRAQGDWKEGRIVPTARWPFLLIHRGGDGNSVNSLLPKPNFSKTYCTQTATDKNNRYAEEQ